MAGVFYGNTHGFSNVITVDMGGTSFDVALVKDAEPAVTTEGMIGEHRIASPHPGHTYHWRWAVVPLPG